MECDGSREQIEMGPVCAESSMTELEVSQTENFEFALKFGAKYPLG